MQLDADYYDHPKTLHLVSLIGTEGDVYPPRLWTWAIKYAKKGTLRSSSMIEVACRWRGEPGRLAKAMVDAGFIESDGLTIHDWMARTGHDLEVYEQKKERLRERRRNFTGTFREHSGNSSGTVPRQFQECSALTDLNGSDLIGTERNGAGGLEASPANMEEPKDGRLLPSSPVGLLLDDMRAAKIRGGRDQLRNSAEGFLALKGFQFSQDLFRSGKVNGWDVLDVSKKHFSIPKGSESAFTPAKTKCGNCGGSGKVAGGVVGGAISLVPCPRCTSERRKA